MSLIFEDLGLGYQVQRILIDAQKLSRQEKKTLGSRINKSIKETFSDIKAEKTFKTKIFYDKRNLFGTFDYLIKGFLTSDETFIYNGYLVHHDKSYRGLEVLTPVSNNLDFKTSKLIKALNLDYIKKSNIFYNPEKYNMPYFSHMN